MIGRENKYETIETRERNDVKLFVCERQRERVGTEIER